MGEVLPLPSRGEAYEDLRGEGRTLRVNWHPEERTLVLSIWHLGQCRATFRLPSEQVPDLVRSLVVAGLSEAAAQRGPTVQPTELRPAADLPAAGASSAALVDAPTASLESDEPAPTEGESSEASSRPQPPPAVFLAPPADS